MSFSTLLKFGAAFAVATGTADVFLGSKTLEAIGPYSIDTPAQAFADSQIRFLGAMWAGWGAMLYWASKDTNRRTPLAIFGAAVVLGGIGRTISGIKHGFPGPVLLFTIVEYVVPPLVWAFYPAAAPR